MTLLPWENEPYPGMRAISGYEGHIRVNKGFPGFNRGFPGLMGFFSRNIPVLSRNIPVLSRNKPQKPLKTPVNPLWLRPLSHTSLSSGVLFPSSRFDQGMSER